MQFREQGKKIQCIRSTYDPISKRSHQKVVATFGRYADKIPTVDLTDSERQELSVWFEARQSVKTEQMNQYRVMGAAYSLAELGKSIQAMGAAMTDREAAATWLALSEVAKALRKAGHAKPKHERSVSMLPKQVDLLTEPVELSPAVSP